MPHGKKITSDVRQCIQNCLECHAICVETKSHCLELGGEHASSDHIGVLADCAQICALSADFMLRGSRHHPHTCRECAEICQACAEDCERMAGGDQTMTECAQVCRRCAESCQKMAGAGV